MNKLLLTFIIILFVSLSFAQQSVFVLIDVSGNPLDLPDSKKITPEMRDEAVSLVKAVITATYDSTLFENWIPKKLQGEVLNIYAGRGQALLDKNGYLLIMPYGDRDTYEHFRINLIQNYPADFDTYYNYATGLSYRDPWTYEDIATAKAADIALDPNVNIRNYYLFKIKGLGGDITGSRPYTPEDLEYLANYIRDDFSLGKFVYKDISKQYSIEVSKVDISKMTTQGTIIKPIHVDKPVLEIISPAGTKKNPYKAKKGQPFGVAWKCMGCGDSSDFTVSVRGEKSELKKVKNKYSTTLQLDQSGDYTVSVSATGINSKNKVYISVSGGGSGSGFWWLLLVILIGLVIYYVIKNDPFGWKENKEKPENKGRKDFFGTSKGSNSGSSVSSGDNDMPSF